VPKRSNITAATEVEMRNLRLSGAKLKQLIDLRWQGSVRAFADVIGKTHPTVYSWIDNKTRPDSDDLVKIAFHLGVRPHRVFRELYEEIN